MPGKAFEIDKQRHETLVYNNEIDKFRIEIGVYRAKTDDNWVTVHFCLVLTHFLTVHIHFGAVHIHFCLVRMHFCLVRIHFGKVSTHLVAVFIDFYLPPDRLAVLRMKFLRCIRPNVGEMRCEITNDSFLH